MENTPPVNELQQQQTNIEHVEQVPAVQSTPQQDSALHVEFGKIKAKAKNFWIAISFIIAMTVRINYLVYL